MARVVLIFDLDGVLVRSTFFSDILMKMICQKCEDHDINIERTTVFQEVLRRFVTKLNADDKIPAYDWDLLVKEYLDEYDVSWTCEIEDFFNSDEIVKYSTLYRDVGILDWLAEKGYEMVIVTNGLHKYQDSVVKKLGLQKFFKKIVMPDPGKLEFVKPYPDIFKNATEGFQEPHTMIGDSLYFDIYGAKQAGYKAIWLMRRLPRKYKELPVQARTEKVNQNEKYLLNNIFRGASFLKVTPEQLNIDAFKPDHVIRNLNELKELL